MTKNLFRMNFHLFEGGAAGAPAGAGDGGAHGAESATTTTPGENTNVQAAAEQKNTQEDRRKAFKNLIQGEYKDLYTEETQRMINRRFADTKTLETSNKQMQPIIDTLLNKYGITDGDIAKLQAAIDDDNSMWESAADEAGMSVDAYKSYQKAMMENQRLKQAEAKSQEEQRIKAQAQQWYEETQAVKAKFPNFDFSAEFQNPQFQALLKSGTPVEHAYLVMHYDEIMSGAITQAAQDTEKRMADNIRANGSRPSENGKSSRSAFTAKTNAMNRKGISYYEDLIARAARGEKVRP